MTLGLVNSGERCEIVEIRHCGGCGGGCHNAGHGHEHGGLPKKTTRAEQIGLRVGKRVEMLKNNGDQLLLLVDDARIEIDRHMAMKITVSR